MRLSRCDFAPQIKRRFDTDAGAALHFIGRGLIAHDDPIGRLVPVHQANSQIWEIPVILNRLVPVHIVAGVPVTMRGAVGFNESFQERVEMFGVAVGVFEIEGHDNGFILRFAQPDEPVFVEQANGNGIFDITARDKSFCLLNQNRTPEQCDCIGNVHAPADAEKAGQLILAFCGAIA